METMSGFMLLTFWLCAGVNYIMLRNMSKRQKGLLLGVTLPPEADALPEVQAIVKQYRMRLGILCLVCAALSVPLAFVQETAIALTLWMLFFFCRAGPALPAPVAGQRKAQGTEKSRSRAECAHSCGGHCRFGLCTAKAHGPVDAAAAAGAEPCTHRPARSAPGPDAGLRH